ncbi:uncharacterized protein LOC126370884 [Pectinophora gossypiella]|uniref:Ribosomal protein mS38 C-terminal domain-containing protein n=1 Tax=Pectinophora gossypiella TaxID=13191 RepID=A0A1E1VZP6_PECGO|nr:uncharacterized protein LOC126370884 [Pectinophora gossypiella]
MMNSFHNTVKYLRLVNLKSAINVAKECKPNYIHNVPKEKFDFVSKAKTMYFSPRSIDVEISDKVPEGRIKQNPVPYIPIVNPRSILPLIEDWRKDEIGLPSARNEEIQAARLIVIRRKKMKKHQRRKLWKRMRYRWARVKQRRRQVKEKIFQNGLLAMIKEANEFSAEAYVTGKIQKANHTPLPTRWRHKRLPQFIIRQLLGLDKKINYKHSDVYKA